MPKVSHWYEQQYLRVRPERLDALTGLRFYAALVVVLFHLSLNRFFLNDGQLVEPLQYILRNGGWFGVTFFFILSGFVLTWSARPEDTPSKFIWRRIAKIVPNHIFTFIVAIVLMGLGSSAIWEAVMNFMLLHAWVPRDTVFFSINHPSWSLSAELFFYLMFPFILPVILRIKRNYLVPTVFVIVLSVTVLPIVAQYMPYGDIFGESHMQSPLYGYSIPQVWFVYAFPIVRLLEFALGMIAARLVKEGSLPRIPLWIGFSAITIGYSFSLVVPILWTLDAVFVVPVAILIVSIAQATKVPCLFNSPIIVRLGEISFALYMTHDIVLSMTRKVIGPGNLSLLPAIFTILLVLAICLMSACLLWVFVEKPSNKFLRRLV